MFLCFCVQTCLRVLVASKRACANKCIHASVRASVFVHACVVLGDIYCRVGINDG